jgi:hypothetical protein
MKINFLAGLACCLLLASCGKPADIDELSQHFFEHKKDYIELANISCAVKAELNTKFLNYEVHSGESYPDELRTQFEQIDELLAQVDSDHLVLSGVNCTLFMESWSWWLAGEGTYMGYSYQPDVITEFNPKIHLQENRNPREKIHFTKALADGWYIEYLNEP